MQECNRGGSCLSRLCFYLSDQETIAASRFTFHSSRFRKKNLSCTSEERTMGGPRKARMAALPAARQKS